MGVADSRFGHPLRAAMVPRIVSNDETANANKPWRTLHPRRIASSPYFYAAATVAIVSSLAAGLLIRPVRPAVVPPPSLVDTRIAEPERGPAWIEIKRPFQMFDLSGGTYARLPLTVSARRDERGTARQETLTYGLAKLGEPFFRILLYRRGGERLASTSLFVETARLAADSGLSVMSSGLPSAIDTRFGTVEVAAATLAGMGARASCLGFRRLETPAQSLFTFAGLACGPATARATDRSALACTLDRLDLISAGDDEDLQRVFATAERARKRSCDPLKLDTAANADDPTAPTFAPALKRSLASDEN